MDYTNDVNYTFKKETKDYKQDLNPIKTSKEQIKLYIEKVYKIPKDISDSIASKIIKDNKVSSNYANFLRLYWLHEGLQNNLETKETKTSKLKI